MLAVLSKQCFKILTIIDENGIGSNAIDDSATISKKVNSIFTPQNTKYISRNKGIYKNSMNNFSTFIRHNIKTFSLRILTKILGITLTFEDTKT